MYFPILFHTNHSFAALGTPNYTGIAANNGELWSTTENDTVNIVPVAMQVTNLNIIGQAPPGNGQSITYTIRKNGADTALSVTLSNLQISGSTDAIVSFAPGDTITFAAVPTAVANHPSFLDVNMLGIAASQVIFSSDIGSSSPSSSAVSYALLFGGVSNYTVTEAYHKTPWAAAGTISNLSVHFSSAPGGVAQYVFTVRKNGVDTGLTVTISGTNISASDNTHTISVVAGDQISLAATPTGTPSSPTSVTLSIAFTPTTAGDCVFGFGAGTGNGSLTVANYAPTQGTGFGWVDATTESNVRTYVYPCYIKSFYVNLDVAPGGTANVTYALRRNRVDTAMSVTIPSGGTTGNVSGTIPMSEGDVLTMGSTPANSPVAANKTFGYCVNFTGARGLFQPF